MDKLQKRLKLLNAKKETLFTRLQLMYNDSRKVDDEKVLKSFLIRYNTLDETREQFYQLVEEINTISLDIDDDYAPNFELLNSFDDLYCHIQSVAKNLTKIDKGKEVQKTSSANSSRLPRIDLPLFSGLLKDWPIFYECFQARVHSNEDLSDVDRVHYLIGKLSDKALAVCSGIPPTGANYNLIWQALVDKYEDKRLLANCYLDQMFDMKPSTHETSDTLNNFLVNFDAPARALQQLNFTDLSDYILMYLALKKLNPETIRLFENSRKDSSIPTYKEVITFVGKQAKVCSRVMISSNKQGSLSTNTSKTRSAHSFMGLQNNRNNNSDKNSKNCCLCNSISHTLSSCSKFLDCSSLERYTVAKEKGRCLNCLGSHKIMNCQSKSGCKVCGQKHHSLLHFGDRSSFDSQHNRALEANDRSQAPRSFNKSSDVAKVESDASQANLCSTLLGYAVRESNSTVLLGTAVVDVIGQYGNLHKVRFLIDSGSQQNILTVQACRRLGLPISKISSTVRGIGSSISSTRGLVQFVICSRFNPVHRYSVNALVVEKVTDKLPQSPINIGMMPYLSNLPLADSSFHLPLEVDGIIAADLFTQILGQQRIVGPSNMPIAIETTLGYVVMGKAPIVSMSDCVNNFCILGEMPLEHLVHKFWELEAVPVRPCISPDDLSCERDFCKNYKRQSSGKYEVALPFKFSSSNLGNSYETAYRRFLSLEKKFKIDPSYKEHYGRIICDYLNDGYIKKIDTNSLLEPSYYIPHHGVSKTDSTTTPLRIVFDASAKSDSSYSLNDLLYSGPKLQNDMLKIFLNFRLYKIAFTADIRRMYLQVNLKEDHQCFQRILWRFRETDPVEVYELTTVTFGVKSSPFLALRTVQQLTLDESRTYPLASEVARRDMYMDDLLTSVESLDKGRLLCQEMIAMFKTGGFDLVKWAINSRELLQTIPEDSREMGLVSFDADSLKVLGMQWHPGLDTFSFRFNLGNHKCSKRSILSMVAKVFDLLGILAPVILKMKLFIKQLWTYRLDWDDTPPPEFVARWESFRRELPLLESLKIHRHLGVFEQSECTLVGFGDACETSYGAVVYIRTVTDGVVGTNLVCAKSKVSPLKSLTIPKLELCAAYLLAKLIKYIMDSFGTRFTCSIYALTDSTVALSWICSSPYRWKTFVSHRVAHIQEMIPTNCWFHVDGENNISDILSRGVNPSWLVNNTSWIEGPSWLRQDVDVWPIRRLDERSYTSLELKPVSLTVTNHEINPIYCLVDRCSSWLRLLRIVVYILRFVKLLPRRQVIVSSDLKTAEDVLIKIVQSIHFSADIASIQNSETCSPKLRKLRPFLQDGILRVGGRLVNSQLSFESQHPVLLPKHDQFVNLLIEYYHTKNMHTGPNLVLALLRQNYWILSARSVIRRLISKCNYCFRFRPKSPTPLMGDLPASRVIQAKPFLTTGVDYAGPISIIFNRKRGVRPQKAYICLFVCLCTKAVHLELVSDLTTANFLQAFKRFLSRRGLCSTLCSDQGTNFIGARTVLRELYGLISSKEFKQTVGNELAYRGIEWKFNPPATPHFGGLWETAVKSVKTHLVKVVGGQLVTYEEMNTLLVQIEALLNSRPLCELSSDPSEPLALTPAHFLTLTPLDRLPASDLTSLPLNRLDRFQLIDRIVQDYWKRWHIEYLNVLQVRQRWNTAVKPVTVGQIVLLHQPNSPPLHWPLGRIVDVFPGQDGVVRVVSVKTKTGTFRRPVVKLCPLPNQ